MNADDLYPGAEVAIVSKKFNLGLLHPVKGVVKRVGDKTGHPMVVYLNSTTLTGMDYKIHGRSIVGWWKDYADESAKRESEEAFNIKKHQIAQTIRQERMEEHKATGVRLSEMLVTLGVPNHLSYGGTNIGIQGDAFKGLEELIKPIFTRKVLGI